MTALRGMISTCNAQEIRTIVQLKIDNKKNSWFLSQFQQNEVQFAIRSVLMDLLSMGVSGFRVESTTIDSNYFNEELFKDLYLESPLPRNSKPFPMHDNSHLSQPNQANFGKTIVTDYADILYCALKKHGGKHLADIIHSLTDENLKIDSHEAVVFVG